MISVRRTTTLRASTLLPQAERGRILARAARAERDDLIAKRQASPFYRTLVDGREGVSEEMIRPGGAIIYRFNTLGQAALFGLAFARERSPVLSGAYRRGWVVAVNGKPWSMDLRDIPAHAEVVLVNAAPYGRKIDTGGQRTIGRGIAEATRQAVMKRFPNITAGVTFMRLTGAMGGFQTPYVLKGNSRSQAVKHAARRQHAGSLTVKVWRKDTRAGEVMTYPAITLRAREGFA